MNAILDLWEMVLNVKVSMFLSHIMLNRVKTLSTTDIDECTVNNGGCVDGCQNTIGSFFCTCPNYGQGFKADGTECVGGYHCLLLYDLILQLANHHQPN